MAERKKDPELILPESRNTRAVVSTDGANLTHFQVNTGEFPIGGQEVLLPDHFRLDNHKRRGGSPVLAPNAGPLSEKQKEAGFNLKDHGFFRKKVWSIESQGLDTTTFALTDDEETRAAFPYRFRAKIKFTADDNKIRQDWLIRNNGRSSSSVGEDMPFAGGLHGYASVPVSRKTIISTNLSGFDPESRYWEDPKTMFYDMPEEGPEVTIPGKGSYKIQASPEFKHVVVWTEEDSDQICFEPWIGNVDALLNPDERIDIPSGETAHFWVETSFTSASQY